MQKTPTIYNDYKKYSGKIKLHSKLKYWYTWKIDIHFSLVGIENSFYLGNLYNIGPDRLESIIYDITEKKIDNPHSRLLLCFSL